MNAHISKGRIAELWNDDQEKGNSTDKTTNGHNRNSLEWFKKFGLGILNVNLEETKRGNLHTEVRGISHKI